MQVGVGPQRQNFLYNICMEIGLGTPTKQFRTVEEELAFLRGKIAERKSHAEKVGLKENAESAARNAIAEYKREPAHKVLHKDFAQKEEEVERVVSEIKEQIKLNLTPEEHDETILNLARLAKEKGIRNALSVVEKLGDFHITDDFHRYMAEYLKEGLELSDVKKKDKLYKGLHMALFEVVVAEDGNRQEAGREKTLKELISGMEQFYAGMLSVSSKETGDNFVSLEIANANQSSEVVFFVAVPDSHKSLFEKQILSIFHNAKLTYLPDDYNIFNQTGATVGSSALLEKNAIFPLKTYEFFDHDPLNVILNSFSKVNRDGEGAAIQLLWTPAGDYYAKRYKSALDKIQKGTPVKEATDMPEGLAGDVFKEFKGLFKSSEKKDKDKPAEPKVIDEVAVNEIKKKIESPVVSCNLRLLASATTEGEALEILQALESSFNQFQNAVGNAIKWKRVKKSELETLVRNFSFRLFDDSAKMPLNLKEVTTLVHFHTALVKSGGELKQSRSATAPAPVLIPSSGILLGVNKNRATETKIFMAEDDRLRHFYTIGQTGTGKSTLLKNMIIQDILAGNGVCMIDPHGNDIVDVLGNIPSERYDNLIYFDPGFTARPMALNMLEYDPNFPEQKTFVVNELFGIFRKLYGNVPEAMGPAFEQYFRNSALLVMEDPESGNTLVDMSRVLSDKSYRALKLSRCKNPLISQFWTNAEKTTGEQGLANYVQYVTNKFDVFLANDIMRPIIAQEKSSFNFREIMDNKKILLVNLSKGRLGDINANLIGLILVGKILMAALSRVDLFGKDFAPFYLYLDEFQNITTDSIATILSEARKYKLSLNIAHQFIAQLEENIRDAVFGNVGSICSFRIGADDAEVLEKQFAPTFSSFDLMNIDNYNAYLKLLVNGKPVKSFNIELLPPTKGDTSKIEMIKELSYQKYGRPREEVEALIMQKYKINPAPTPPLEQGRE